MPLHLRKAGAAQPSVTTGTVFVRGLVREIHWNESETKKDVESGEVHVWTSTLFIVENKLDSKWPAKLSWFDRLRLLCFSGGRSFRCAQTLLHYSFPFLIVSATTAMIHGIWIKLKRFKCFRIDSKNGFFANLSVLHSEPEIWWRWADLVGLSTSSRSHRLGQSGMSHCRETRQEAKSWRRGRGPQGDTGKLERNLEIQKNKGQNRLRLTKAKA